MSFWPIHYTNHCHNLNIIAYNRLSNKQRTIERIFIQDNATILLLHVIKFCLFISRTFITYRCHLLLKDTQVSVILLNLGNRSDRTSKNNLRVYCTNSGKKSAIFCQKSVAFYHSEYFLSLTLLSMDLHLWVQPTIFQLLHWIEWIQVKHWMLNIESVTSLVHLMGHSVIWWAYQ